MAVALLIALAALLDFALTRLTGRWLIFGCVAPLTVALAIQLTAADAAAWVAFAMLAATVAWVALRLWLGADIAAVWLAVAIAAGVAAEAVTPGSETGDVAVVIIAIFGVAVFLTHPANEVCRAVLDRARVPHETPGALEVEDAAAPELETPQATLRGGRFIGPLERWSVTVLALLGAQAVIVGLMAAKGIGRYPELAGDKGHSSKAEEFLIGSLVSWLLAAGFAAYLWVAI